MSKKGMRMEGMVSLMAERIRAGAPVAAGRLDRGPMRCRRISPQAGRALEILGHAIEYLTDEYVHRGGSFIQCEGEVEAVQLLIGINRQIYFDCPEVPPLGSWWRWLLRLNAA
jgi:hypothetical protein